MSASGESPADEEPGVNADDKNGDPANPTKDVSDVETEPAMLEEEEMPTYMSLTSSSKPDDSRAELHALGRTEDFRDGDERASSPYVSEQGAESICVLSSGEESDRRPYGMMEDYDSEDMDMEEEEEDEEDEDEDDSCPNDNEEDSDGDIEPEQFERSSDDFVLRYDSGLEKHHKERSRSLQDLTNSRGNLSRFVGKRRSIDIMGSYETGFSRQNFQPLDDPLAERKKISRCVKYDHVPSKVKMYIQEMKEQRRLSLERKNRVNPEVKSFNETNTQAINAAVSTTRINPINRMIKTYAQSAINEITTEEQSSVAENVDYSECHVDDNRAEIIAVSMIKEAKEIDQPSKNSVPDPITENLAVLSENHGKSGKSNGLIDFSTRNNIEKSAEPMEICTVNGQSSLAPILNIRSLRYEEYANGDRTSSGTKNIDIMSVSTNQDNNGLVNCAKEVTVVTPEREIVKVASNLDENREISPKDIHNVQECDELRDSLNRKFDELSSSLKQKNDQIDNIRAAYQRTLAENINLKRELSEMKKFVEHCRAEHHSPVKKAASVQTETVVINEPTITKIDESKPPLAKLLSSSVTSALSSIEQWTDSNCSAAISIDPPNIENALNSDDSFVPTGERTPRKTLRPLSHSFITSSRILQTLANITQGRTKIAPNLADLARNNSRLEAEQTGQSKVVLEKEENCARVRKRKASDMLGPSGSTQPFKMPYTPGVDTRRKIHSDSDTDGVLKTAGTDQQQSWSRKNDNDAKSDENMERIDDDLDDTGATDVPKNVKCFVYRDEPDSKERSFLIQAEDSTKNDDISDKAGNVRECGPYLLGNVEIRMSEANGTINIWGKEVNQSIDETDVDVEMEDSALYERTSFVPRSSHDCQTTPASKFPNGSTFVCSTNKKSRIAPQLPRTGIGKYFRQATSNLTGSSAHADESEFMHYADSSVIDNRTNGCEHCELRHKRIRLPSCEHLGYKRVKQHSCCLHDFETNERDCERELHDGSAIYETMSNVFANLKECTTALHNATAKHNCANDGNCRNQMSQRRNSVGREDDYQQTKKRCSACADDVPTCGTRLTTGTLNSREHRSRSHSHVSCEDEDHPLISNGGQGETPEIKRRKSNGKRVRGILTDLLRGCGGGCRDPTSTSTLPKIRLTPCTPPPQASSSTRPNSCTSRCNRPSNDVNEKCCHSCSRRADMRAQLENQWEIFRVDMERLRSRSDAFLEMLNMLNAETD